MLYVHVDIYRTVLYEYTLPVGLYIYIYIYIYIYTLSVGVPSVQVIDEDGVSQ